MKFKNFICPLLTGASFVLVLLSLFIGFTSVTNLLGTTTAELFANYDYTESAFLVTIGQVAIIASLAMLVFSGILMLLKLTKSKCKAQKLLGNIAKIVLLLLAVAILVVFLVFFSENTTTLLTFAGGVGFYFAVIGTFLGAISAIIGLRK